MYKLNTDNISSIHACMVKYIEITTIKVNKQY